MNFSRRGAPSPAQRLRARAVFAVPLLVFLILGMVMVGDFAAQWWVLLLPVALLVGPVRAVRRETRRGPNGDQQTIPWG